MSWLWYSALPSTISLRQSFLINHWILRPAVIPQDLSAVGSEVRRRILRQKSLGVMPKPIALGGSPQRLSMAERVRASSTTSVWVWVGIVVRSIRQASTTDAITW